MGGWRYSRITLHPESDRGEFRPIVLELDEAGGDFVVGELLMVLQSASTHGHLAS